MPRIDVHISDEALERLDAIAGEQGSSRSAAVRALIETGSPASAPADLQEALSLLSASAREGSVAARVALARLLADRDRNTSPARRRLDELAERRRRKGKP